MPNQLLARIVATTIWRHRRPPPGIDHDRCSALELVELRRLAVPGPTRRGCTVLGADVDSVAVLGHGGMPHAWLTKPTGGRSEVSGAL